MSVNGWMDKENVIHTHPEILFNLKKEKPAIGNKMDVPGGYRPKWNKSDTER